MVAIAVHGSASRYLPAERGTVALRIEVSDREEGVALRAVTVAHERVVAEAKGHEDAGGATWWGSDQVVVHPNRIFERDGQVSHIEYAATTVVRVKFRDFGAMSRWVTASAIEHGVFIDGIEWTVLRTAVEREVRIEALQDAIGKAEAYALAIGASGAVLERLWEPGLRPASDGAAMAFGACLGRRGTARARHSEAIELRPDDIEIRAAVTADVVTTA